NRSYEAAYGGDRSAPISYPPPQSLFFGLATGGLQFTCASPASHGPPSGCHSSPFRPPHRPPLLPPNRSAVACGDFARRHCGGDRNPWTCRRYLCECCSGIAPCCWNGTSPNTGEG